MRLQTRTAQPLALAFTIAFTTHFTACSDDTTATPDAAVHDLAMPRDLAVPRDLAMPDAISASRFCDLPGSIRFDANGRTVVPGGGANWPDLKYLKLPEGFCAHFFANVGNARNLRFAPGGELFVASPTRSTTGGGPNGLAAIAVLPDDDHDGVADATLKFVSQLGACHGLVFTAGDLYYQNDTRIYRVPYKAGDRAPSATPVQFADVNVYQSGVHWPKPLDIADDGTLYVGNGGDQGESCDPQRPFRGGILALDTSQPSGMQGGTPVVKGLRNPIALRCARGHDQCFALELALDYSQGVGREKLIPIKKGDDWGYPCCATRNLPYQGVMPVPDCSKIAAEGDAFLIGDTPFGLDFETGLWPAPWKGAALVALHGEFGTWAGARLVSISMDPNTGLPLPASDIKGQPTGALSEFASGWDDRTNSHGRPASLAFSSDGRLFLANDVNGDILWMAPLSLPRP